MIDYLLFLCCVFFTLMTLMCVSLGVRLAWDGLIKPIMDRVKKQKDDYWEKKFDEAEGENIEYRNKLRRIGFDDDFISCIDPCCRPKISKEYKDETTRSGCMNVMVKFSMLEREYTKAKEDQQKIFKGEM